MGVDPDISNVERQKILLDLIEQNRRMSVTQISEALSISEATVRRDLKMLAREGKIQRVRGGAIKTEKSLPELPILQRENDQAEEKDQIGRMAAELVKSGETVFLGSGTTVLATARYLRNRQNLTVITNSFPIISQFIGCEGINLILLGGMFRESELSFIGHITEMALSEVCADKVILGARALSLKHGLTSDYLPETLTDRAIIRLSSQLILVADHTKFGSVSTAFLAPIEDIDVIVTDRKTDPEFLRTLRKSGIEIIIA